MASKWNDNDEPALPDGVHEVFITVVSTTKKGEPRAFASGERYIFTKMTDERGRSATQNLPIQGRMRHKLSKVLYAIGVTKADLTNDGLEHGSFGNQSVADRYLMNGRFKALFETKGKFTEMSPIISDEVLEANKRFDEEHADESAPPPPKAAAEAVPATDPGLTGDDIPF